MADTDAPVNPVVPLADETALAGWLLTDPPALHVAFFYAEFHAPSRPGGQMDTVVNTLASIHPAVKFAKIDAEGAADVSERFEISAVPTFLFFKNKTVIDRLEGADSLELTRRIELIKNVAAPSLPASADAAASAKSLEALSRRLDSLIHASHVMLFMKGSPAAPECGFSRQLVELLADTGVAFGSFDVLTDPAVRAGMKERADFPTFPQLWVGGALIGGVDIVSELKAAGELAAILKPAHAAPQPKPVAPVPSEATAAAGTSAPSGITGPLTLPDSSVLLPAVADALRAVTTRAKVMLFMKGSPGNEECGFSEHIVKLLHSEGIRDFGHFDILRDPAVREGLKLLHAWPTFPQLVVDGAFVGGLDVITAMRDDGGAGSLRSQLGLPPPPATQQERMAALSTQAPAVLFMKGTAAATRCGFSEQALEVLGAAGLDVPAAAAARTLACVDILADEDARAGMKVFSAWPTFPQLYVRGAFVGGLDVMREMHEGGELAPLLRGLGPGAPPAE